MKKTLPYILSVSLFVYLIIVFTFASAKLREVKCEGLQVDVDGTEENAFIDETEVLGIIKRGYGDIEGCNIVSVDKDSLEHILDRNSENYVDEDGKIMPLSRKYTSRVVVATGNISRKFACNGLYPFIMTLRNDEFWDALVEQIVVEKGNEVVLIPKVGNFRIVLGTLDDMNEKLENLRLFLREGIVLKGWNVYKEINLKFKNQIVCVKR